MASARSRRTHAPFRFVHLLHRHPAGLPHGNLRDGAAARSVALAWSHAGLHVGRGRPAVAELPGLTACRMDPGPRNPARGAHRLHLPQDLALLDRGNARIGLRAGDALHAARCLQKRPHLHHHAADHPARLADDAPHLPGGKLPAALLRIGRGRRGRHRAGLAARTLERMEQAPRNDRHAARRDGEYGHDAPAPGPFPGAGRRFARAGDRSGAGHARRHHPADDPVVPPSRTDLLPAGSRRRDQPRGHHDRVDAFRGVERQTGLSVFLPLLSGPDPRRIAVRLFQRRPFRTGHGTVLHGAGHRGRLQPRFGLHLRNHAPALETVDGRRGESRLVAGQHPGGGHLFLPAPRVERPARLEPPAAARRGHGGRHAALPHPFRTKPRMAHRPRTHPRGRKSRALLPGAGRGDR